VLWFKDRLALSAPTQATTWHTNCIQAMPVEVDSDNSPNGFST
jgi:hypothetical protein